MKLDIIDLAAPGSLRKRLAWFAAIWAMSVAALGVVAYGIRLVIS
ncbi:hypothetical protein BV97_04983 [Novosphingobium resinovorum]|uniref:DUF2474 domain-containing protein n=1 Tax=Novosphingobium resinovorum TaxID=158500 RepID=A0A031JIN1_9SPHN|nr:DUF2474 domain-containing protein [Novosphingobium resinovorum]EZP73102.1 hypothetical protein BV97_04983 [Novosphingobium resinovorum]